MKRLFDFMVASFLCFIGLIPFLFVWALIRINLGSPVLFKQVRTGKNGRDFSILKFRSMNEKRDKDGVLLPDEQRLTGFGKLIRSLSLDELPSLINVLKGDMSLVGPRPLLTEYLPLYNTKQARRHEVLPGITGWAQVNGRNAISWEEKFDLDVWYVDHQSFFLDIKIIFLTFYKVVQRKDINTKDDAPMPKFTGSAKNGC